MALKPGHTLTHDLICDRNPEVKWLKIVDDRELIDCAPNGIFRR